MATYPQVAFGHGLRAGRSTPWLGMEQVRRGKMESGWCSDTSVECDAIVVDPESLDQTGV